MKIKRGSTSVRRLVFIADTSSTTGAGLANLVYNSSGLVAYYFAGDLNNEAISLVTATLGTFASGGFVAVDNTNMPGWYEIGIPDAALDGGNEVAIQLRGATNMAPVNIYIALDTVDYQTDAFGALKPTTAGRTLDVSSGGEAGIDFANIGSPTATVNLSGTTIKTATDIETDTQDIQSRLPAALTGGRIDASVGAYQSGLTPLQPTTAGRTLDVNANGEAGIDWGNIGNVLTANNFANTTIGTVTNGVTVSDKTGFSLASNGLAQVTAWTVAITGNITGNLSGSVGSISGVTFPSNFGSLGIDPSGAILVVNTVDELGAGALSANGADQDVSQAVWSASLSSYTTAGTFGARIVRSTNSNNQLQLTGSYHAAADIHELQPAVINSTHFASNWFTATGLATDAVAEIADGVWDEAISGHLTAGSTGKALSDSGSAGNPWTTDLATGYSGTQAGNILNAVKSQTDLIQAGGTVTVSTPVTATGQITTPLIIGDDYLNANGRAFSWTVPLPSGYVIATASCKFGMRFEDSEGVNSFIATGTIIDAGSGNVTLRFDVPRTTTGELRPGWYDWSVEIVSASGTEITRVKSGKNAEWQAKQT